MKKFSYSIFVFALLLLPIFAFAVVPEEGVISLPNPLSAANFTELIEAITNWLLVVTLPIIVLLIVYAGFQYMFAGLSPEKQKESINIIKYAIIGYAIILLSKVFLAVITGLFS